MTQPYNSLCLHFPVGWKKAVAIFAYLYPQPIWSVSYLEKTRRLLDVYCNFRCLCVYELKSHFLCTWILGKREGRANETQDVPLHPQDVDDTWEGGEEEKKSWSANDPCLFYSDCNCHILNYLADVLSIWALRFGPTNFPDQVCVFSWSLPLY